MSFLRPQRTVAQVSTVAGFGYWSGEDVQVEFHPAPADAGIVFVFSPPNRQPIELPVGLDLRLDVARRTVLARDGVQVEMIEHVLAALSGVEVDNCRVVVTASEMPGCDGSSLAFVEALDNAGYVEQSSWVFPLVVRHAVRVELDDTTIEAYPSAAGLMSVEYYLDYGNGNSIGRQNFAIEVTPDSFRSDLAPARTFVLQHEADAFKSQGKGTRVTPNDLLIFGPSGPVENRLRFADECVRHKTLDVVGDMALAGRPIIGHIVAHKSGHRLNARLVERLLADEAASGRRHCA
jgi:UDP-3-O-acyl N-acetylglucosamine deacetylase